MNKQIQQYMLLAFFVGFAFEFGGQLAWILMDIVKIILRMPIGWNEINPKNIFMLMQRQNHGRQHTF